MKSCRTKLSWLALAIVVAFPGFTRAQNPDPCDFQNGGAPERCFEQAFSAFCGNFSAGGDLPQVCEKTPPGNEFKAKRSLRWLALEEYCAPPGQADQVCTVFAKSKDHPAVRPAVLVYDHSNRAWRAHGSLDSERIERDVAGKPTVSLGRREELIVVVENTNPLLYTLTAGAATEVDIPELVEVKKLATLLGGNISALVQDMNAEMVDRPSPAPGGSTPFTVLQSAFNNLQSASKQVTCSTSVITNQASRAGHFIQRVELGGTAEYPIGESRKGCEGLPAIDLGAQSDQAFERLASELAKPAPSLCLPFLQAAERAFGGDFTKSDDIRKAVLDAEAAAPTCTADMSVVSNQLLGPLRQIKAAIEQQPQPADLTERLRALARPHLGDTKKLVVLTTRYGEVHAGATALLGKRDEVRKAATQVELFERRLRQHLLATLRTCSDSALGQCVVADSISRRLVLANEFKPVRWDKIQNHSLMLEANAPLASVVVPSRPAKSEASYSLDSVTRGLWGIAASVVTTRIDEPTFTAVSDGAEKPKFTITKTDKETRAGEIALLVDYGLGLALFPKRSTWVHGLGLEFGAGTDTDQPAFFGGLSYRLGRFVRFGAGISYQQVTELDGQHEGQIVNSATDLRTRDRFTAKPYASFSVALEAFTLFSSGDE